MNPLVDHVADDLETETLDHTSQKRATRGEPSGSIPISTRKKAKGKRNDRVCVQRSIDFLLGKTWAFSDNLAPLFDYIQPLAHVQSGKNFQRNRRGIHNLALDLVFCTRLGGPLERINVRKAMRRLIDAANENIEDPRHKIPRIRLYDLRHTAATLALSAGVSIKIVQEMLGHSNAALTLNVYSHVLPHMQDAAADLVEALLRNARSKVTENGEHQGCGKPS